MKISFSKSSLSYARALIPISFRSPKVISTASSSFRFKRNYPLQLATLLSTVAVVVMLVSGVAPSGRSDAASSTTKKSLNGSRELTSGTLSATKLATSLPLAPPPPTTRYVKPDGVCGGNSPCYTTIQAAINAANAGDTINVFAGTYAEEINIDRALTLLGPNAGINPNTGTRVAEAVIIPTFSDPLNSGFNGPQLVTLAADGVTFNGFTLDGDNPSLTSGVSYNGADVDAEFGIYGTGNSANPDAVITNNIVKNIGELCIWIDAGNVGAPKDSVSQIADNKVDNCFGAFGQGIRLDNGAWVNVINNVVTRLRVGIVIENYTGAGTPSTHPPSVIGNNNVMSFRFGIRQNLHQAYDPPGFTISNNTVSSYVQSVRPPQVTSIESAVTSYQGIRLDSIRGTDFVTVSGNTVTGNRAALSAAGYTRVEGLYITNAASTSPNISFDHNNVRNFIRGAFNDSPVVPTFTCNIFQGNDIGLYNSNDPTGSLVANNNSIIGNGFGIQNDGPVIINAKQNWWGAANGPGSVGPGSGDQVSTNVDFSNFLTSAAGCAPKADQQITFSALVNKTFGDADFTVSATVSSGLAVSFAAGGNCTVTGNLVHILGAGSCTITASQVGDSNYNPAPDVAQSFTIAKGTPTTTASSSANPSDFGQNVTFTANVSFTTGTPTGLVQFKDGAANLGSAVNCLASGGNRCTAQVSVSTLTAGPHTITANYLGDVNFNPSSGTLSGGQTVKSPPSLAINDVSLAEGDGGTRNFNFTVTLSAASNLTVNVGFATANGTATLADSDYQSAAGTLTFSPGDLSKTVTVLVNGDQKFEPDETFFVNLSSAVNATISDSQGQGTILNDDAQGGIISFSQANFNVNENAGSVTITVTRTADISAAATVDYATDDTGAPIPCSSLGSGLASSHCDFDAVFGTLSFAAAETQKTLTIPINQDAFAEGPEVFRVNLTNPTGGAVLATPATATVTISDSAAPAPNAIDDTTTFVRQQYRDFLNREADMPGLVFWRNNIDKCNDPAQRPAGLTLAQCIDLMRVNTSAAFFLSIEFQNSGILVRSFYVAALNRPATNNMPAFVEFERDAQAVQRGVIVDPNNNAWQTVLANNRTAFMNDFVMRAEFVGLYPTTDTPTQYVDKLYAHAGVTPGTPQERTDAIGEFGAATTAADPGARGRALLRITQNAAFQQREVNRAFVQMQYLGYLRRDPNAAPDTDFSGYNFWLNKLNSFNGNFVNADMVRAFITSSEYRQRFGP